MKNSQKNIRKIFTKILIYELGNELGNFFIHLSISHMNGLYVHIILIQTEYY